MDSNSDKDRPVAETEPEVELTISDKMREVDLGAAAEDKPTCDKTSGAVDVEQLIQSGKEVLIEAEDNVKIAMSDMSGVDPEATVGDDPTHDENSAVVDVEQLILSRQEALENKQETRKASWHEQSFAEWEERDKFKLKMRGIPRDQITSWKDKLDMSNLSKKWRKKFLSERTEFLFHQVFPILSRQSKLTITGDTKWLLRTKDILRCRRVSKTWKEAVDNSLSDTTSQYRHLVTGPNHSRCDERAQRLLIHSFATMKKLNSFKKKVKSYRGPNPFPFRHLYLGCPSQSLEGTNSLGVPYWDEMGELLNRWGNKIWSVVYKFEDGSIEMMYEYLVNYLSLMPNLQELVIMERDRSGDYEGENKDVLTILRGMMEAKPLPELPHLHTIVLAESTPLPLIIAMMEKYGANLNYHAMMDLPAFENSPGDHMDLEQLVCGRPLPVRKYSCQFMDASRIPHLKLQSPELISIDLTYLNAVEGPDVENIFKTVNSCGSTLRQLQLKITFNLPELEIDWRDRLPAGVKLELPHLERLELTVEWSELMDADFLLPLVSLRELTLSYLTMYTEDPALELDGNVNGIIQFAGYRDRLYDSNIWSLLPELKFVIMYSVTTNVYTRDGYQQHQGGQN